MNFEDVSLHAISRDRNLHPRDAIYIIVDSHFCLAGQEDRSVNDEEDSEEDSEADISELILEPQNPLTLPSLYETLKICQVCSFKLIIPLMFVFIIFFYRN